MDQETEIAVQPARASILIADVEKNHGFLLKQELEDAGYAVDLIVRGDTFMPSFDGKRTYDIVLLDMQMPGLDYYQRLRRIKDSISTTYIIVVFTDTASSGEKRTLLDAGADTCFAKHEIDNLILHLNKYRDRLQRAHAEGAEQWGTR